MLVSRFVVGTFVFFFLFFNFFCYAFIYCVLVFPTSLVHIRYCLISVFIFSVVHHYHCTRRFVSFALHLFVHNVRSRFSSRVTHVGSIRGPLLLQVPLAIACPSCSHIRERWWAIAHLIHVLGVSSSRLIQTHSLLCFYLLLFLPFFLCLFLYFHKKRLS